MRAAVQLRVPEHVWAQLRTEVRRPSIHEPVVFGLVSHGKTATGTVVLVRDLVVPPASAFVRTGSHGAKWTGAYNVALLNEALERDLGIIIFHYHDGPASVTLSQDDEQSAHQLLPAFQMVAGTRPHGSVVLGEVGSAGLLLLPEKSSFLDTFSLRFFGTSMTTLPQAEATATDLQLYRRRPLVDGPMARSLLRGTSVAVVGLSGGGTQVATQLAGLGIGKIIGIDAQRVERDNLVATDEFGWLDLVLRRRKTAAVRSRVRWTNRKVWFTGVDAPVPQRQAPEALKCVDVIVGCVNNLHARADLQEIAWRYCIPYVDIGLGLHPLDPGDEQSEIGAISGNVFTLVPGGPCLWCSGFLTEEKLERESGGAGRSYLRDSLAAPKSPTPAAFVSSFNGVLAGLAVNDVLQLILGFAPALPFRQQYDGFRGTVSEVTFEKNPRCPRCSSTLAAGDPLWR